MSRPINEILSGFSFDENGVWCSSFENFSQEGEIKLREKVAAKVYNDYISEVAKHHSVQVMDFEVRQALRTVPKNGVIVDVGGCWGWHWRNLNKQRPDIQLVIVDFLKANLRHAQYILGSIINKSIHLVHGDATQLSFPDNSLRSAKAKQVFPDPILPIIKFKEFRLIYISILLRTFILIYSFSFLLFLLIY